MVLSYQRAGVSFSTILVLLKSFVYIWFVLFVGLLWCCISWISVIRAWIMGIYLTIWFSFCEVRLWHCLLYGLRNAELKTLKWKDLFCASATFPLLLFSQCFVWTKIWDEKGIKLVIYNWHLLLQNSESKHLTIFILVRPVDKCTYFTLFKTSQEYFATM